MKLTEYKKGRNERLKQLNSNLKILHVPQGHIPKRGDTYLIEKTVHFNSVKALQAFEASVSKCEEVYFRHDSYYHADGGTLYTLVATSPDI